MSASRWSEPKGAVAQAFDTLPADARRGALALRHLILEVADQAGIKVEEALRWGQPAYLAPKGTTLRLGVPKAGGFAIYAHCQSQVIPAFRDTFAEEFRFEGNRAVLFTDPDQIKPALLSQMIRHALTYHDKPT